MTLSDTKQTIAATPIQRGSFDGQAVGFICWFFGSVQKLESVFTVRKTVRDFKFLPVTEARRACIARCV
jgi:hypothetical protein